MSVARPRARAGRPGAGPGDTSTAAVLLVSLEAWGPGPFEVGAEDAHEGAWRTSASLKFTS